MSRWLELNGEKIVVPTRGNYLLTPSGNGLNRTWKRQYLLVCRPIINGYKEVRVCKDWTYLNVIREHCELEDIRGPYLGLAAAHIPEILAALHPHVEQEFTSCQLGRSDYKLVSEFLPHVQEAYQRSTNIDFFVERLNILDWMIAGDCTYNIFDLDMMGWMNKEVIDKIVKGMQWSGGHRCVLAIWHCSNREENGGNKKIDGKYRPYLLSKLNKDWHILRHDDVYYYESQTDDGRTGTPMHVDVVTLERKWKKAS